MRRRQNSVDNTYHTHKTLTYLRGWRTKSSESWQKIEQSDRFSTQRQTKCKVVKDTHRQERQINAGSRYQVMKNNNRHSVKTMHKHGTGGNYGCRCIMLPEAVENDRHMCMLMMNSREGARISDDEN